MNKLSMSFVLNNIDGIWSCCGEENIIIITTKNKGVLEEALLRPGCMDVHVHIEYCGFE